MFPTTFEFFVLITNHPSLVFFEGQRASPNEIPVLVPIFYQIFYLAVPLAFSPLRLLVRARNSLVEQGQGLPAGTGRSRDVRDFVCNRSSVAFCRLNRGVAEQEPNLLDFPTVCVAQLRGGPAQIIRRVVLRAALSQQGRRRVSMRLGRRREASAYCICHSWMAVSGPA